MSCGTKGLLLGQLTETPLMPFTEPDSGQASSRRDQLTAASPGMAKATAKHAVRARALNFATAGSKRFLEGSFVGLAIRLRHASDEIRDPRAKRELCTIRVLESELIVADDPGTMENAAGTMATRSQRPKDINHRDGAIGIHILDNHRGTCVGVPCCVAPHPKKPPVRLGDRRNVGQPVTDVLFAKHPTGFWRSGGHLCIRRHCAPQ